MKTVHFTDNFDYWGADPFGTTYAYYAGDTHEVTEDCANAAIMVGAAVLVEYTPPVSE